MNRTEREAVIGTLRVIREEQARRSAKPGEPGRKMNRIGDMVKIKGK